MSYFANASMNGIASQASSKNTLCISGIAESPSLPLTRYSNIVPSTMDLKKARRLAAKSSTLTPCHKCKQIKLRCDGARPCAYCLSISRADSCTTDSSDRSVERPLPYSITTMEIRMDSPWPNANIRYQWSSQTIRGLWSMGYRLSSLANLFDAIPPHLASALECMFSVLERIGRERSKTPPPLHG